MKRRRILATMTGIGASALAGCSGGGDGTTSTETETATETTTSTSTGTQGATGTATQTETTTQTATETRTDAPTQTATRTPTETETGDGSPTVVVSGLAFAPVRAEVSPGTTVTWRSEDGVPHDVTATQYTDGAAQWDFGADLSGSGSTVEYTFEEPGVYQYLCTIHGERAMCGAVLVGDVSLSSSMPCE